jgi:hypothetical protein
VKDEGSFPFSRCGSSERTLKVLKRVTLGTCLFSARGHVSGSISRPKHPNQLRARQTTVVLVLTFFTA